MSLTLVCVFSFNPCRACTVPLFRGALESQKATCFLFHLFIKKEEIKKKMRLGPDACKEDGRKHCLQIQAQELRHALAKRYNRAFFLYFTIWIEAIKNCWSNFSSCWSNFFCYGQLRLQCVVNIILYLSSIGLNILLTGTKTAENIVFRYKPKN